jgi:NADH-quinone oxidoreductase subunit K
LAAVRWLIGYVDGGRRNHDQQATNNNQPSDMEVAVNWYLALSAVLFTIGTLGVLFRRNAIVVLMSVELMLNAVNLTLVTFSQSMGDPSGQMLVFFSIAVAAAEAAVGLAIVIAIFRSKVTVDITEITLFKH